MVTKFYYIRDGKNQPIITVCLLKDEDTNVAWGKSSCSHLDNPCKKVGRKIAKQRALWSMATEENGCKLQGDFKALYNPLLTEFERKLLNIEI